MEEAIVVNKGEEALDLPPGFRFHPTDEEIITYYLTEKVLNRSFSATAIGEADLNKCEPWDLPKIAKMGEKNQWYFFCQRDRKYPTGMRTNRATECGYWKATGKDKEIYKGKGNLVGMKKTLVFYTGRAPKGEKSNWVMHEFRLQGKFATYTLPKPAKEEWVVCKIFHKPPTTTAPDMFKNTIPSSSYSVPELLRMNSLGDDLLDCSSLPPLMDPPTNFKASSDAYYCLPNKAELAQEYDMHNPIPNYYSMMSNNQVNFSTPITQHQIGTQNALTTSLSDHNHNYRSTTSTGTTTSNVFKMAVKSEYMCGGIGLMEMDKECNNMEQMSSKSNHSGLTNDRNAETSSAVSNNNSTTTALYPDLTPPSLAPLSDFECLWDDY